MQDARLEPWSPGRRPGLQVVERAVDKKKGAGSGESPLFDGCSAAVCQDRRLLMNWEQKSNNCFCQQVLIKDILSHYIIELLYYFTFNYYYIILVLLIQVRLNNWLDIIQFWRLPYPCLTSWTTYKHVAKSEQMCKDASGGSTYDANATRFNKSASMAVSGARRTTSQELSCFPNVTNAPWSTSSADGDSAGASEIIPSWWFTFIILN